MTISKKIILSSLVLLFLIINQLINSNIEFNLIFLPLSETLQLFKSDEYSWLRRGTGLINLDNVVVKSVTFVFLLSNLIKWGFSLFSFYLIKSILLTVLFVQSRNWFNKDIVLFYSVSLLFIFPEIYKLNSEIMRDDLGFIFLFITLRYLSVSFPKVKFLTIFLIVLTITVNEINAIFFVFYFVFTFLLNQNLKSITKFLVIIFIILLIYAFSKSAQFNYYNRFVSFEPITILINIQNILFSPTIFSTTFDTLDNLKTGWYFSNPYIGLLASLQRTIFFAYFLCAIILLIIRIFSAKKLRFSNNDIVIITSAFATVFVLSFFPSNLVGARNGIPFSAILFGWSVIICHPKLFQKLKS